MNNRDSSDGNLSNNASRVKNESGQQQQNSYGDSTLDVHVSSEVNFLKNNTGWEQDPSLFSYLGLQGEENRRKLAELFLRPTTWKDYCEQVSPTRCLVPDQVAAQGPQDEWENDRMFVQGLYTGHFRKTEENDCDKYPLNCTGHIADYPCGWSSHVLQQTHHLNIPVKSSGSEPGAEGYSYSQLKEIWAAASPTGWTGFKCEFVVETEDFTGINDDLEMVEECGDAFCYNGGKCMVVQEPDKYGKLVDYFGCDCAIAFTDTHLFSGPTCSYKSTSLCTEPKDGESFAGNLFCVNHGTCRDDPVEDCDCPSGWTGTMCESEVEDDAHADEGEECGDGYCYNGGSCVMTKIISHAGGEYVKYHCDCAEAFTDTDLYAGESCEHKSTAFCSEPHSGDTLVGVLFCANGGSC
jgi:hypothetical protein